jgi:hypothetical protein
VTLWQKSLVNIIVKNTKKFIKTVVGLLHALGLIVEKWKKHLRYFWQKDPPLIMLYYHIYIWFLTKWWFPVKWISKQRLPKLSKALEF